MRPEHCQEEKEKLGAKIQVFQNTFHFKARTERYDSACMNKEKLLTGIDTDKFALIFDSPVLMCVFCVPFNKMISQ